jgi:cold shock CspA family protein
MSAIAAAGLRTLEEGQTVQFDVEQVEGKKSAINIVVIG